MRREAFGAALLVVAREIGHDSFRFYYSHDVQTGGFIHGRTRPKVKVDSFNKDFAE